MFERILVVGGSGYIGPWVMAELRHAFPDALICNASRQPALAKGAAHTCLHFNLTDAASIRQILTDFTPDAVVHLASLRSASLDELLAVNVTGFESLLAHLSATVPSARIVVMGSSAELGRASLHNKPLDETSVCHPVDDYGISKLAQTTTAMSRAIRGQDIVCLRLFNLLGPAMQATLLPGCCAQLIKDAMQAGEPARLTFGPLDTFRDYVDVRDVARAVSLALMYGQSGQLYHLGSGISRSGRDIVQALIDISGADGITFSAQDNASPLVPFQTANIHKAAEGLLWKPTIDWMQSLKDLWQSTVPGYHV